MAWRLITEADLRTRISGTEIEALRAAHLADGQEDPLPATILQIANVVRRACESSGSITLGPDGTIPEDLLSEALDLIVRELMKRPGYIGEDPVTKIRMEAAAAATKLLQRVAAGEEKVAPDGARSFEDISFISSPAKTHDSEDRLMA
jgi:hypothetical protein